ncbi:MAG: hypothetical protein ACE5NP_00650 [Anaerolineae bacterium]
MRKIKLICLLILMGTLLLGNVGCSADLLPWISNPAQAAEEGPAQADEPATRDLRREIQLLNLINGLDLSTEQMRFIVEKAREAEGIREEIKGEAQGNIEDTAEVLEELRATLMQGENISSSLRERFYSVEGKNHGFKEKYEEEMTGIALEIEEILGGHQIYALEGYVPCVIPPKGEARVGQVEDTSGAERQLARLRGVPPALFERKKEDIALRVMERLKSRLPRGFVFVIDEEEEKERILSILEEVRSLSDVEFELEKTNLVQELISKYEVPKAPVDVTVKIERFLLDPQIIPLLEEKLANREEG